MPKLTALAVTFALLMVIVGVSVVLATGGGLFGAIIVVAVFALIVNGLWVMGWL